MAIQTAIKVEGGVDVANCYVRIHDITLKKNRSSTSSDKHYVTYSVTVYRNASDAGNDPEGGRAMYVRDLDRFKIVGADPAVNLSALCYNDLKTKIVAKRWEANTGAIESV
jgi:hypothetical protein